MEILNEIKTFLATGGINLLFGAICAIIFVLIGFKLSGVLVRVLNRSHGYAKLDSSVKSFLNSMISIGTKVLVVVIAATILGIDGTALSTVLGTAGLAIGLALQGSLSNFAGGVMILFFKPFGVGDFIDNHTDSGTVKEIGIFYTTIVTPDNKRITIPNGALSNATVVNYSAEERRRVDLEFTAAYSTDIDKALRVMRAVAEAHALVLKEPAPLVRLVRQDASALSFAVRAWCKSSDYWTVYFDLNESMKKAFDKVGIEIPFNQLDVHINGGAAE